ncbi:MAG: Gfo/Idh/MocA family oxidoreductase [Anaerolineae bacterium]|nr:Gfo/Idh/MocA family oxidoreductase [Anaerolineae bacterium]
MAAPLRAGILGCGGIANRHAQVLAGLPEVTLVAFCDQERTRAEDYSVKYAQGQAAAYQDYREMFDDAGLDLVYICLPPYAHAAEVAEAARRGVHVFIEKPIALDSQQAWRMVEAAESAGIRSQVGFMYRFGEAVERLKQAMEQGTAGPPALMVGTYYCNHLHAPWWRDGSKSGGQVVEQIIHLFDLARYLLGEPRTVYARLANLFHRDVPGYTAEDVSGTIISFDSGALATIAATNNAIPGQWLCRFDVVARHLTAFFSDVNRAVLVRTDQPGDPGETIASEKDVFLAESLDLIRAIRQGRPTRTPLREGALSLDLVLAAAYSAREGREVALPARSQGAVGV